MSSSAISSMRVSSPPLPRCAGSTQPSPEAPRARRAASSQVSPARPASSTRSTRGPASFCGRAKRCTRTSSATSISRTGRVSIDETMVPKPFQELQVCPSNAGGKNWMAGTYSPRTRLMYQPMLNMCMLQTGNSDTFSRGMGYAVNWIVVEDPTMTGRPQYPVGRLDAISLDSGKVAWHYEQRAGLVSGLVSTAGGLVFARRCQSPLQGHRRRNRARAVGDDPRRTGLGPSDQFRGGRPATHRSQHRRQHAPGEDLAVPASGDQGHAGVQHAVRVPPARAVAGYFVTASRMMWSAAVHPCDGR